MCRSNLQNAAIVVKRMPPDGNKLMKNMRKPKQVRILQQIDIVSGKFG
jgi:hypothetical protein